MSDMRLKIFTNTQDSVEWSPHVVRYSRCEHLKEVILEFELLIFDNMSDTSCHYHLVRSVLEQYLLLFEC